MICIILLLLIASYANAELVLVLASQTEINAMNLLSRAQYIKNLKNEVITSIDNIEKYTISIKESIPNENVNSINVALYSVLENSTRVDPPNFQITIDSSSIYFGTSFSNDDLSEKYGCIEVPSNDKYVGKICQFNMDYIASESDIVLATVSFSMSIKIPKIQDEDYSIIGNKVYKNLCDCSIDTTYVLTVDIYTDKDCTQPLKGSSLEYGSTICLKLSSQSLLANFYYFTPTSVMMNYNTITGNILSTEMIPVTTIVSGKGTATAALDVLTTGTQISFVATVILNSNGRRLEERELEELENGNGIQGRTSTYTVVAPKVVSQNNQKSMADRIGSSIMTILIIGIIILA